MSTQSPTNVYAVPGNTEATVTWNTTGTTGESVTYTVTSTPGNYIDTKTITITASNMTISATVTALRNGTSYTFSVSETISSTTTQSAVSNSVIPATAPDAPSGVVAVAGNGLAVIDWNAPYDGGSEITSYLISYTTPGGANVSTIIDAPATNATITGLQNAQPYTFTVYAINKIGQGSGTTSNSVTPQAVTAPFAPSGVVAVAGNGLAVIDWNAPPDGGSEITSYKIIYSSGLVGGSTLIDAPATNATITGLNNGQPYNFTVAAINKIGQGIGSTGVTVTPQAVTLPFAPSGVVAVAGNGLAVIDWNAPSDGGSEITSYKIIYSSGSITIDAPATNATITGLNNGQPYTFTVAAINKIGQGSGSTSNSVTPYTVPDAPSGLVAVAGNAQATVSWGQPSSNGSNITSYTVTSIPGNFTATALNGNRSAIVTGLTNGIAYSFNVYATNEAGNSALAPTTSVTPLGKAGLATNVIATAGNGQASVSWTAPLNTGGYASIDYEVTSSPGNFTAPTNTTSVNVTGLINGTAYTFTVVAKNLSGSGLSSAASNSVIPATAPFAPSGVVAVAGNGLAVIDWNAPPDGGSEITSYLISYTTPGGANVSTIIDAPATNATITGLQNAQPYTFTVAAINKIGQGSGTTSNSVTPQAVTLPGAPSGVVAVAGNGLAVIDWNAPSDGGSEITSYLISYTTPGGANVSTIIDAPATNATITGLQNAQPYTFTVAAINKIGQGSGTTSNSVTPQAVTVPNAPSGVVAVAGNGLAVIDWNAPPDGGSEITSYKIIYSSGLVGGSTLIDAPATNATITGLNNGQPYTFTVAAINKIGQGSGSTSVTVTPQAVTLPGAPSGVVAVAGNGLAVIDWNAPSDGGSEITSYKIIYSSGSITIDAPATNATITGLNNGQPYTFTVAAINKIGQGSGTTSNSVTPYTVPDAPSGLVAVAGNAQATVSWGQPSSNGSNITSYTVTSIPGNFTATALNGNRSAIVTGLTNGIAYSFNVYATNKAGNSALAPTTSVTPLSKAGLATNVIATAGNGQASVSWTAPLNTGGYASIDYEVTSSPGNFTAPTNTTSVNVTGLINGTAYTFTVVAKNLSGSGLSSAASNTVIPANKPDTPSGLVVTVDTSRTFFSNTSLLKWNAPYDGGSEILYYTVLYAVNTGTPTTPTKITIDAPTTSATITGLTKQSYSFSVSATNIIDESEVISIVVTVPTTPSYVYATPGNYSAVLFWPVPENNGSPITSYTITTYNVVTGSEVTVGDIIIETSEKNQMVTANVSGLINGSAYRFNVTATNSIGTSGGTMSNTVIPGTPDAPTSLEGVSGNTNVLLSWSAPAGTVTGYIVSCINNNTGLPIGPVGNISISGTTANVSGLENGTPYTFTVSAVNDVGVGLPSTPITVTPEDSFIKLTFSQLVESNLTNNTTYSFTTTAGNTFTCNLTPLQQAILADGGNASPYVYTATTTITAIGTYEFAYNQQGENFDYLTSAFIPLSVILIEDKAFFNCPNLDTIQFEGSVYDFVDSADKLTPPLRFGRYVFGSSGLKRIHLPNRTVFIDSALFINCTSLTEVIFPTNDSFTTIPPLTCNGCTNLVVLQINSNVKSIVYLNPSDNPTTAFGNIPSFLIPFPKPPPTPTLFTDTTSSHAYSYFHNNYPGVKIVIGPSCFNFDTKILCLVQEKEKYIPVQNLRKGDLVKTYLHGYRKVDLIEKGSLINNVNVWHNCMYKMKKTKENGLIEDLIVTGGHGILVDNLLEEEQYKQEKLGLNKIIDDKHLVTSGLSTRFVKIKHSNVYEYYSLVLENDGDDNQRFGIWANGILAETPSKNQFMMKTYLISETAEIETETAEIETETAETAETPSENIRIPNHGEMQRRRSMYLKKKLEELSKIRVQHNMPVKKSKIFFTHKY